MLDSAEQALIAALIDRHGIVHFLHAVANVCMGKSVDAASAGKTALAGLWENMSGMIAIVRAEILKSTDF